MDDPNQTIWFTSASVRLSRHYLSLFHGPFVLTFLQLKPEFVEEYKVIHSSVWPSVLAALERAHIIDYSINHYPPLQLLIATMKYTGNDYEADMALVAKDPETQRWWALTDGMQESFNDGATGSGKEVPWWTVSGL